VHIETCTPGSARGVRKPQRHPLVSVGRPLSKKTTREPVLAGQGSLFGIEKSRGDYGSTAIAAISTSAPFFGRAATWIVARAGAGFLKCVP
jgi:hypothetical protein